MPFVDGPVGPLEVRVTGSGSPVTVFAHGLAGSITGTRPFGSAVAGTRVFLSFRGHGATAAPSPPWTYDDLEAELRAVTGAYGARRALGVSLGAATVLRAALATPDLFDRIVLVLPGALARTGSDAVVRRMADLADRTERNDVPALAAALVALQPAGARIRPEVAAEAEQQARRLAGTAVATALRELPGRQPLPAGADLGVVTCPVLVLAQEGDPLHPVDAAADLAARLPSAGLHVFDDRGLLWAHRAEVRRLVSAFLNA